MRNKIEFKDLLLHERLLLAIEKLNFSQCTEVQRRAIPAILEKKDLLVSAETGSGKTAALLLPVLHQLLCKTAQHSGTRVLILAPTRELARQLCKQVEQLASHTRIKAGLISGGENFKYQKALIRKNPEIIIATPGRLLEHLQKHSIDFEDLETLILDEADRMLDMGFSDDVLKIASSCNKKRQTLLFSATINHHGIKDIAANVLQSPARIIVNSHRDKHKNIQQQIITADHDANKTQLLCWLLANESYNKAIVFTNKRTQANKMRGLLKAERLRVDALHGDMDQAARKEVIQIFRQGGINVLIATDVAARGLDIQGVDLVINFDMARNATDYIHRIGRTGRAGGQGLAISLIKANEWKRMLAIEKYLHQQFERRNLCAIPGKFKGYKKIKSVSEERSSHNKLPAEKAAMEKSKQGLKHNRKRENKLQSDLPIKAQEALDGGWGLVKRRSAKKNHAE